jgi:tetratricopeptide (TPR) repeat protein
MKSAAMPPFAGRIAAGAIIFIVAGMILPLCSGQVDSSPVALGRTKSMAATQHEIVMLLIKQKEYEKAAVEAQKIFEMKWPEDQEPLLLQELLYISGQFLSQGQAPVGLQFVEKNSKCFKKHPSQVAILKETGYLYKSMGQNDKAIDCFRKARELENKD